jgi:hypothetical protein
MSASLCFLFAGAIGLFLWVFDRSQKEPLPEPIIVPDPTVGLQHRPNLKDGSRVFVEVGLQFTGRPAEQILPIARQQISEWALDLKKAEDAFDRKEYARLRSLLYFRGIREVSLFIAPIGKKDQTLSPIEELEQSVALHQQMESFRQKYSGSSLQELIDRRIAAMQGRILDPEAL